MQAIYESSLGKRRVIGYYIRYSLKKPAGVVLRMPVEWGKQIARLTSTMLNPFLVSFLVLVLISFQATSNTLMAIKWSLIASALSVVPVLAVVVYLVHSR